MSVTDIDSVQADDQTGALATVPEPVEVRRNAGLAALLGVAAAGLGVAYLARAVRTAAPLDWALVVVMAVLAVLWLRTFVDARTPLLVADAQGVRLRLGRTWRGLPWTEVRDVLLRPRRGLRDGRLTIEPYDDDRVLADLDAAGRRQARWSTRLYGAPLAVPLGLTTRVVGATPDRDLGAVLRELAGAGVPVVELVTPVTPVAPDPEPEPSSVVEPDAEDAAPVVVEEGRPARLETDGPDADDRQADPVVEEGRPAHLETDDPDADDETHRRFDPRPRLAAAIAGVAGRLRLPRRTETDDDVVEDQDEDQGEDQGEDPRVDPAQDADDDTAERPVVVLGDEPEAEEPDDVERTVPVATRPRPLPVRELRVGRRREVVSSLAPRVPSVEPSPQPEPVAEPDDVVEELPARPVVDPVIGPQLAAARRRLALGVDGLAERTRIRPHVIEAIEVDDFGPCGGDFYARGHLRTLARVLGVEAAPLLADYDERYAHAPIDPRQVFETELASAHQRRATAGPNWTLLVGALMALVLAWSVARLFLDQPTEIRGEAPVFRAAATPKPATFIGEPVKVRLTASRPAHVTVRNADGRIVLTTDLLAGQSRMVRVVPPVKVTASHGDAVTVGVDGQGQGLVGDSIRPSSRRLATS